MLRILCFEDDSWVDYLPHIELLHNCTPNTSSGFAPYDLLYVTPPHTFGDKVTSSAAENSPDAVKLAGLLAQRRDTARSAMLRAQALQKKYHDGRRADIFFLPGEWARLVYSGTLKRPSKLSPSGTLVKIVQAMTPLAYRIKVPEGSKMHDVISVEHLRRYKMRDDTNEQEMCEKAEELGPVEMRIVDELDTAGVTKEGEAATGAEAAVDVTKATGTLRRSGRVRVPKRMFGDD